jgi:hypothetical protein
MARIGKLPLMSSHPAIAINIIHIDWRIFMKLRSNIMPPNTSLLAIHNCLWPTWLGADWLARKPVKSKQRQCHWTQVRNFVLRQVFCALAARVPGYRSGHSGFSSLRYQIFWIVGLEWGPLSLVSITEEGIRCADHATPSIRKSWH